MVYVEKKNGLIQVVHHGPGPGRVETAKDDPEVVAFHRAQWEAWLEEQRASEAEQAQLRQFRQVDLDSLTNEQLKQAVKWLLKRELRRIG